MLKRTEEKRIDEDRAGFAAAGVRQPRAQPAGERRTVHVNGQVVQVIKKRRRSLAETG